MSYRKANSLLLVALIFLLCALVGFLLYRQDFFQSSKAVVSFQKENLVTTTSFQEKKESSDVASPIKTGKTLKNMGSCGDESKNESILSYSVDLFNALGDDILGIHCIEPKPEFPNYSFVLQDPSLVRIAEMTPDYKYIFYLKVLSNETTSTYFLYKTDISIRQTSLVDTFAISNDWPLQKDFYEDKLMPRQNSDGRIHYFWFESDPKGRSNTEEYLKEKTLLL